MGNYILTNGVIVTMNKNRDVLEGYSVVILDDVISSIEKTENIINKYPDAEMIDCSNQCILPGFIDCGGYAGYELLKGFLTESPATSDKMMDTLLSSFGNAHFWKTDGTLFGAERLRAGITTGTVIHDYMNAANSSTYYENIRSHISGYTTTGARLVAGADFIDENTIGQMKNLIADYSNDPLVSLRVYLGNIISSIRERKRVAPESFNGLTANDQWRLDTAYNISAELKAGIIANAYGNSINILHDLQTPLLNSNLLLLHCNDLTYREVMIAAEKGICVAHAPESTIRYCPFSEILEAGVTAAIMSGLRTDGQGMDMLQAVRRAQMIEQLRFDDIFYLPIGKQLEAITIDAAKALGIDHMTGSLEPGKLADIITVDMSAARTVPWEDMPVHRLMMDSNAREISNVFVAGNPVISKRELLLIDERKLLKEATTIAQNIASESNYTHMIDKPIWSKPYKNWTPMVKN